MIRVVLYCRESVLAQFGTYRYSLTHESAGSCEISRGQFLHRQETLTSTWGVSWYRVLPLYS
jgi:hypothetical protein